MKTKVLFLLIFLFSCSAVFMQSNAQVDYKVCYNQDSLIISGKWVNSIKRDNNSPLELRLKIENQKNRDIEFSYEILLYKDLVLREKSELSNFAIKAGKVKTGKFNGIRFIPATLSNEEIYSESFSWEINVKKVE